jgi:protein-tyrosine phosphatase
VPFKSLIDKSKSLFARAGSSVEAEGGEDAPSSEKVRVLFVCMGNICRSPTARGVFEQLVKEAGLASLIKVDSAGTHAYHLGSGPDKRAIAAAAKRGYDLSRYRARRIEVDDFQRFDYILVMDYENLAALREILPPDSEGKVRLFMEFAGTPTHPEVPDPYYGGGGGFVRVLDLVEDAARGLLAHIRAQHLL